MSHLTDRNIPVAVEAELRLLAERSGLSLNQTVIELLEKAVGVKSGLRQRDLSAIAATWDDGEADAFDRATGLFESVDDEVWR